MSIEIPAAAPKQIRELGGKRDRLRKAARDATAELLRLDARLETARSADRQEFADRLARDVSASNPGDKHAAPVRQEIEQARSRKEALLAAVANAEDEIGAALEAHGAKWLAAADAEQEKRRRRYEESVEGLGAARAELDAQEVLVRWLRSPGSPLGKISRPRPVVAVSLRKINGNSPTFEEVFAALRADAQRAPANATAVVTDQPAEEVDPLVAA